MLLHVIVDLFANAVGIFVLAFFGFIVLFYGLGLLISIGICLVVYIVLNPIVWLFIIALMIVGVLLLIK